MSAVNHSPELVCVNSSLQVHAPLVDVSKVIEKTVTNWLVNTQVRLHEDTALPHLLSLLANRSRTMRREQELASSLLTSIYHPHVPDNASFEHLCPIIRIRKNIYSFKDETVIQYDTNNFTSMTQRRSKPYILLPPFTSTNGYFEFDTSRDVDAIYSWPHGSKDETVRILPAIDKAIALDGFATGMQHQQHQATFLAGDLVKAFSTIKVNDVLNSKAYGQVTVTGIDNVHGFVSWLADQRAHFLNFDLGSVGWKGDMLYQQHAHIKVVGLNATHFKLLCHGLQYNPIAHIVSCSSPLLSSHNIMSIVKPPFNPLDVKADANICKSLIKQHVSKWLHAHSQTINTRKHQQQRRTLEAPNTDNFLELLKKLDSKVTSTKSLRWKRFITRQKRKAVVVPLSDLVHDHNNITTDDDVPCYVLLHPFSLHQKVYVFHNGDIHEHNLYNEEHDLSERTELVQEDPVTYVAPDHLKRRHVWKGIQHRVVCFNQPAEQHQQTEEEEDDIAEEGSVLVQDADWAHYGDDDGYRVELFNGMKAMNLQFDTAFFNICATAIQRKMDALKFNMSDSLKTDYLHLFIATCCAIFTQAQALDAQQFNVHLQSTLKIYMFKLQVKLNVDLGDRRLESFRNLASLKQWAVQFKRQGLPSIPQEDDDDESITRHTRQSHVAVTSTALTKVVFQQTRLPPFMPQSQQHVHKTLERWPKVLRSQALDDFATVLNEFGTHNKEFPELNGLADADRFVDSAIKEFKAKNAALRPLSALIEQDVQSKNRHFIQDFVSTHVFVLLGRQITQMKLAEHIVSNNFKLHNRAPQYVKSAHDYLIKQEHAFGATLGDPSNIRFLQRARVGLPQLAQSAASRAQLQVLHYILLKMLVHTTASTATVNLLCNRYKAIKDTQDLEKVNDMNEKLREESLQRELAEWRRISKDNVGITKQLVKQLGVDISQLTKNQLEHDDDDEPLLVEDDYRVIDDEEDGDGPDD